MTIKGNIHSLESFGTVDGPGIRFVVFMQGCPLRCLYCHNPDTWDVNAKPAYQLTSEELLTEVLKYKNYISRGGVTVTGGEPLLQAVFLKEFFLRCKEQGIHTALDTSGCIFNHDVEELLKNTDLVLLDIKALNAELHKKITGASVTNTLKLLTHLREQQIPVWIRHVIVPGLTDKEENLTALAQFLKPYENIEKIELLPYHTIGTYKYDQLNINYPLKDVLPPTKESITKAHEIFKKEGFL